MNWLRNSKLFVSLTKHQVFEKTVKEEIDKIVTDIGLFDKDSPASQMEYANKLRMLLKRDNCLMSDDQIKSDDPLTLMLSIVVYKIRCKLPYYTLTDDDGAGISIKTIQYINDKIESVEKRCQEIINKKKAEKLELERQSVKELEECLAKNKLRSDFKTILSEYASIDHSDINIGLFLGKHNSTLKEVISFDNLYELEVYCKMYYDYAVIQFNNSKKELAKKVFLKVINLFYSTFDNKDYLDEDDKEQLSIIYINSIYYYSLIHYQQKKYELAFEIIIKHVPDRIIEKNDSLKQLIANYESRCLFTKEIYICLLITALFIAGIYYYDKGISTAIYAILIFAMFIFVCLKRPENLGISEVKYILSRPTTYGLLAILIVFLIVTTIAPYKIHTMIGDSFRKYKNYDRAITYYNKAIQGNPNYGTAYNNRGVSYYQKCNFTSAVEDYNSSLKINRSATTTKNKAKALACLGKGKEAHEQFLVASNLGAEINKTSLCAEFNIYCKDGMRPACDSIAYLETVNFCGENVLEPSRSDPLKASSIQKISPAPSVEEPVSSQEQDLRNNPDYDKISSEHDRSGVLFEFARKYYKGDGVKQDENKAISYYKLAAQQGHVGAIEFLKVLGVSY